MTKILENRKMRSRAGFTLAETVVVLGLIGTLLVISIERFPTRQRQINDETAFWQRLDTLWKQTVLVASATGHRQVVTFWAGHHEIHFGEEKEHMELPSSHVLKLPPTMRIKKYRQVQIGKNGHADLAVVKFQSTLYPGKLQKFSSLMGWGAYRVAKIADA